MAVRMYWYILLLMLSGLMACQEASRVPVVEAVIAYPVGLRLSPVHPFLPDAVMPETPAVLKPSQLRYARQVIPGPLHIDSALVRLYPGAYGCSVLGDEARVFVQWKCPDCRMQRFRTMIGGDEIIFPDTAGVETWPGREFYYTEHGKQKAALFFSNQVLSGGELPGGRFTGGVLGASLWEKTGEDWVLTAFHPGIGLYGSYGEAMMPDTFRADGGDMLFLLEESNGAAGRPYLTDHFLFRFSGHTFISLLHLSIAGRMHSGLDDWSTAWQQQEGVLTATTTGRYHREYIEEEELAELPKDVRNFFSGKDSINFTITSRFRLNGDALQRLSRTFQAAAFTRTEE